MIVYIKVKSIFIYMVLNVLNVEVIILQGLILKLIQKVILLNKNKMSKKLEKCKKIKELETKLRIKLMIYKKEMIKMNSILMKIL